MKLICMDRDHQDILLMIKNHIKQVKQGDLIHPHHLEDKVNKAFLQLSLQNNLERLKNQFMNL